MQDDRVARASALAAAPVREAPMVSWRWVEGRRVRERAFCAV
jgi:hypothetical protein